MTLNKMEKFGARHPLSVIAFVGGIGLLSLALMCSLMFNIACFNSAL